MLVGRGNNGLLREQGRGQQVTGLGTNPKWVLGFSGWEFVLVLILLLFFAAKELKIFTCSKELSKNKTV